RDVRAAVGSRYGHTGVGVLIFLHASEPSFAVPATIARAAKQEKATQRGPCVGVESDIFISPSPSARPALAPACARIRPAFPLAGDQRNYLSHTNRALHQAPACQYCSL